MSEKALLRDELADVTAGLKTLRGLKTKDDDVKEDILSFTKKRAELLVQLEELDNAKQHASKEMSGAKAAKEDNSREQMSDGSGDDKVPVLAGIGGHLEQESQTTAAGNTEEASSGPAKVRSCTPRLRGSHLCWFRCGIAFVVGIVVHHKQRAEAEGQAEVQAHRTR